MKKIICILLAVCSLCSSGFTTAFAEEQTELNSTLELLNAIGISNDYTAETVQVDAYVTRATFAEYICKMIGADEMKSSGTYYHDVSKEHWAFDYIGVLTEKILFPVMKNKASDRMNIFRVTKPQRFLCR